MLYIMIPCTYMNVCVAQKPCLTDGIPLSLCVYDRGAGGRRRITRGAGRVVSGRTDGTGAATGGGKGKSRSSQHTRDEADVRSDTPKSITHLYAEVKQRIAMHTGVVRPPNCIA